MKIYLNAYLQKNLGDDLFVHILLNRYPDHQFYSITTDKSYRKMFPNLHVLDSKYLVKAIRKLSLKSLVAAHCDLNLTLGGSVYMEKPGDKNRNFSLGKQDHYILGVNFGPYQSQKYFDKIHTLLKDAKDVCFREQYSYDLFRDLPHARVESDIVFSLPLDGIEVREEKHVVFSVISCASKLSDTFDRQYKKTMADMVDYYGERGYKVTLMSFCAFEGDLAAAKDIAAMTKCPVDIYDYRGNIPEALQLMASAAVIVGSRFHANILGLRMGKPVIPVLYSDKTMHVLEDLGFEGLIIDIRALENFRLSDLEQVQPPTDVRHAVASAQNHFKKLDERLNCHEK